MMSFLTLSSDSARSVTQYLFARLTDQAIQSVSQRFSPSGQIQGTHIAEPSKASFDTVHSSSCEELSFNNFLTSTTSAFKTSSEHTNLSSRKNLRCPISEQALKRLKCALKKLIKLVNKRRKLKISKKSLHGLMLLANKAYGFCCIIINTLKYRVQEYEKSANEVAKHERHAEKLKEAIAEAQVCLRSLMLLSNH